LALAALSKAADIVNPSDCESFPCLIFNDEFDYLDHKVWEHEITMGGGGNYEFQMYVNNRSITYTRDSTLFIRPELVSNWHDEAFLSSGTLDFWGSEGQGDVCTGNGHNGCLRTGNGEQILPPVMSGRLRTMKSFGTRYGRIEVRAKMPKGEWLWPAIWTLPTNWPYGLWPASGEIDIIESRGNDDYGDIDHRHAGSTLHWGPHWPHNRYDLTTQTYAANDGSFADSFHVWRCDWTDDKMEFFVDEELVMTVDPGTNFWDFGQFADLNIDNPWVGETDKMTPFNQEMFLIMNVAVGGTNGFFPDDVPSNPPKPWSNDSPHAFLDFWNGRDSWLPTWENGEGRISENAAMQVDYIRVWKMFNEDM